MKIGFENEYFLKDAQGRIVDQVPYTLPYDAAGHLVEVRSDAADNPPDVLASFQIRYNDLERAARALGYELANLAQYDKITAISGGPETAGFHIHFSRPEWLKLGWPPNHYTSNFDHAHPPAEIDTMIQQLDTVFKKDFEGVVRSTKHFIWRPKPYGWEYRRLPATVSPGIVAKRLTELYYPTAQVAPRKKVA